MGKIEVLLKPWDGGWWMIRGEKGGAEHEGVGTSYLNRIYSGEWAVSYTRGMWNMVMFFPFLLFVAPPPPYPSSSFPSTNRL